MPGMALNSGIVKTVLARLGERAWRRPAEVRAVLRAGQKTCPPDPKPVEEMAEKARKEGRLDDAIALNRLIFHWYPRRLGAPLRLLRALEATDAPDLVETAEEVGRRFPTRAEPVAVLVKAALRRGDAALAESLLAQHSDLEDPLRVQLLTLAFEDARSRGATEEECRAARALFDDAPSLLKPQLRLLRLMGDGHEDFERISATVAERFPDRPEPRQGLARAAERRGADLEAARIWMDLAARHPDNARFAQRIAATNTRIGKTAKALAKDGKTDRADELLLAALGVFGPDGRFLQTLARIRHRAGRHVAAAMAWKDWMALSSDKDPALWLHAARTFSAAGMPGDADEALSAADAAGASRTRIDSERAALLEKLHRWDEAEALRERLVAAAPDDDRALAGLVRCLAERDPEAAEARLDGITDRERLSFALLRARIRLTQRRLDYDAALALWQQATELFPDEPDAWAGLAQAYAARFDTETAISVAAARPDLAETEPVAAARAEVFLQERRLPDAAAEIDAMEAAHGRTLRSAQLRARQLQLADDLEGAAACLAAALAEQPGAIKILHDLAVLYIRANRVDAARALIADIPPEYDSRTDVAELRSWDAARRGAIEEARALWTPAIAGGFPALRPLADPLRADRPVPPPARVQLFAFMRNERDRLAHFLDHYRRLGVERFHIVDNASDDGSADVLSGQDDVFVFRTDQSYRDAVSGMRWINHLVERYGGTGWSLHADVDEFLVLPGIEGRPLQDYLPYLEGQGFEAVRAFLLDMYAPRADIARDYAAGENPRLRCPFFDDSYRVYGGHRAPYAMVEGGMRERLFRQYGLHQSKTPLIRAGLGIRFLASSHFISPARIADLTGAMLHYKFLGQFKDRLAEEAGRRQYSNAAKNIVQLNNRLSDTSDAMVWTGPDSRVFASSRQLVEMGLLERGNFDPANMELAVGDGHARVALEETR